MNSETRPLILLHTAVFLAGWTGIFGRLITLSGLPLVWYRIMVSVVVLALVLALMKRLHRTGWKAIAMIAGCGSILAVHPDFRRLGIGRALLEDGIKIGLSQGFTRIALVADAEMPHLINLYSSIGFVPADHRHTFGTDFLRMIYTV